jgi:hypothetical protein
MRTELADCYCIDLEMRPIFLLLDPLLACYTALERRLALLLALLYACCTVLERRAVLLLALLHVFYTLNLSSDYFYIGQGQYPIIVSVDTWPDLSDIQLDDGHDYSCIVFFRSQLDNLVGDSLACRESCSGRS